MLNVTKHDKIVTLECYVQSDSKLYQNFDLSLQFYDINRIQKTFHCTFYQHFQL